MVANVHRNYACQATSGRISSYASLLYICRCGRLQVTVLIVDANASNTPVEIPSNAGEAEAPVAACASSVDFARNLTRYERKRTAGLGQTSRKD